MVLCERTWHSPREQPEAVLFQFHPTENSGCSHTTLPCWGRARVVGREGQGRGDTPSHHSSAAQRRSAQRTDQKPPVFREKRFRDNGEVKHRGAQLGEGPLGDGSLCRLQQGRSPPSGGGGSVKHCARSDSGEGVQGRAEEAGRFPPSHPPARPQPPPQVHIPEGNVAFWIQET